MTTDILLNQTVLRGVQHDIKKQEIMWWEKLQQWNNTHRVVTLHNNHIMKYWL